MPLVHSADMLNHAYRHNYAVGAFGVVNLDFLEGVMQAAENCRAPVIINLIEAHFTHYDFELLMPSVLAAARRAKIPVAIHLDHGISIESAQRGIQAGCNGVMVDTSLLPLDENLKLTREIVAMAHSCGVAVEGELGYVPETEEEGVETNPEGLAYTLPAEARAMVERTGIDSLAVSIGTVHGRMKGTPKLDFTRLAKVSEAAGIPLVIHGGTGLSDDQCRKLIAHGVAKINYYTALSETAAEYIKTHATPDRKSYKAITGGVRSAIREEVERCIHAWGSSGRAAEVLEQCRPWREVEHVVMYNAPEPLSANAIDLMTRQGRETLAAIPGVRRVLAGTVANGNGKYCWLVRLASPVVIESFNQHPKQAQFAKYLSQHGTLERAALNFELRE